MPRRIPDYPDAYAGWNLVSTYGSYISFAATLIFLFAIVYALLLERRSCKSLGEELILLSGHCLHPPFHQFELYLNSKDNLVDAKSLEAGYSNNFLLENSKVIRTNETKFMSLVIFTACWNVFEGR